MANGPVLDKQAGLAQILSLFSTAALSEDPNRWRNLARSLAVQLRGSGVDWRDLVRALDRVRTTSAGSEVSGLFDRAALLAMRMLDSAAPQKAPMAMLDLCAPGVAPEEMLRSVVTILRSQIPFDLVSYAEYYHGSEASAGSTLVRGRFAMDDGVEFRWPARWVEIPDGIALQSEGEVRWVADSEEFYKENPQAATLRNNIVMQEYERRGATSFLVAPLLDGGRVKAALTLARRRNSAPFGQADQHRLEALSMERVLRRVKEAFDMRAHVIAKEIIALFTPQADAAVLAQELVEKLGRAFEWEYVGLFRVNRARDKFEVVAEYDAHGDLKVPSAFEQDLTAGMLGRTLEEQHPLYVPDVTKKPVPHGYIEVSPSRKSALTFPIKIRPGSRAEIEWILDIESSQFDAFPFPEQEQLRKTVVEVERAVALWFEARLAAALLNAVGQGVVVLGGRTRIERANAAARKLLGLPKDIEFPTPADDPRGDLATYAVDRTTLVSLAGDQNSGTGIHLRLRGADQIVRTALAVASVPDEAFHRRLVLLADVEQKEWVGALKYMDTAVRTVAAQAHGRLLLAGALLRNAQGQLPSDSPAGALIDRAARNLSSADLPYERIASVFDVVALPKGRNNGFLDLAAELRRFRTSLPQDEADGMELGFEDDAVMVVRGDPERLAFAFRSLLGHLLAIRSNDAPLKVSIDVLRGRALVSIVLTARDSAFVVAGLTEASPDRQAAQTDQIAFVESLAFAVATHAVDAIRIVLKAHGGRLQVARQDGEVHVSVGGLRLVPLAAYAKFAVSKLRRSNEVSA